MFNGPNCDRKSQLSGILTQPSDPRDITQKSLAILFEKYFPKFRYVIAKILNNYLKNTKNGHLYLYFYKF